jgi:hypothetical protein
VPDKPPRTAGYSRLVPLLRDPEPELVAQIARALHQARRRRQRPDERQDDQNEEAKAEVSR